MKPLFSVQFNDGSRVEFFKDSYRFFPSIKDGVKLFNLYQSGEISWASFGIVAGIMRQQAYADALGILALLQDRELQPRAAPSLPDRAP